MVNGCIRFYMVESGNNCYGIALHAGVSLSDFYAWNPAVQNDCSMLMAGEYVCIGISGYATTITSGSAVPATPTPTQASPFSLSTSNFANAKLQSGMVTGCHRFYDVQKGDGCYNLASEAGIGLS